MPRKKNTSKGGKLVARIPENCRPMRPQERTFGFPKWIPSAILHAFTTSLFGFDIFRYIHPDQENDFIYPDDDDDDDDDDYDDYDDYNDDDIYAHNVTHNPLRPCPRIRELTDEEADTHAEELIDEQQRKEKTERNKRKKLRKKEKKRLEKENAANDILPEEESGKSDPLTNLEGNCIIDSNAGANECRESGQTQNETEEVGHGESSVNTNNKEERSTAMTKKEDENHKQDSGLNNSYSATGSVPKETCNQRPVKARNKRKTKSVEVKQLTEEKPSVVEKPEAPKKEENQNTMDSLAAEYAKRSRELASLGNIFAASGQFETAVKCFTDAIKYKPKEFKLFGNRSLCYERMERYENALRDADLALCLEPNWIKGLFRKGKALFGLKRYYEASLIYKEVLQIQGSSVEATQELERAQALNLTEMGFSWEQSSEALKSHGTLEGAVESLFVGGSRPGPGVASASCDYANQPEVEEDDDMGEWTVQQSNRSRARIRECAALTGSRMKSQSLTPRSRNPVQQLYAVWVGMLAPAVTYATLHELFSRAGTVYSIKMLLEHQCAFVNYTRKEDCDNAIHCIDGLVVAGTPLMVRNPNEIHTDLLSNTGRECFFWRSIGCTRPNCTYKHDPKHKNIDQDKFPSKLRNVHL